MNPIEKRLDNLKANVKTLNKEVLTVSDNLVEASLASGAKWQKLMAKVMNEGTVLFGKQQDLVLSTLEEVKGQILTSNKRFIKLVGINLPKAKKAAATNPAKVKKTTKANPAKAAKEVSIDDLKVIDGIGPKVAALLNEAGITTFHRLAATPVKDLKAILENAGSMYKTMDPSPWKKQANLLINGKVSTVAK